MVVVAVAVAAAAAVVVVVQLLRCCCCCCCCCCSVEVLTCAQVHARTGYSAGRSVRKEVLFIPIAEYLPSASCSPCNETLAGVNETDVAPHAV